MGTTPAGRHLRSPGQFRIWTSEDEMCLVVVTGRINAF